MSYTLGQEPAFPIEQNKIDSVGCEYKEGYIGMSKRFYAACAAMQGIISYSGCGMIIPTNAAKLAFEYADELLFQENK